MKYYFNEISNSDSMAYVICKKCGGYYELEEGESPDDFEACNCGGNLSYVESIQTERKNQKILLNAVYLDMNKKKGLRCFKCGSFLRRKTNYQNEFKINHRNRYDYRHVLAVSSSINFFERIEWSGVTSGIVFYIVAIIVTIIVGGIFSLVFGLLISGFYGPNKYGCWNYIWINWLNNRYHLWGCYNSGWRINRCLR